MKKISVLVVVVVTLGLCGSTWADGIWPRNQVSIFDPRLNADPWDEPFNYHPNIRVSTIITGVPERERIEDSFWRVIGLPLGNNGSVVFLKLFAHSFLHNIGLQREESRRNIDIIKN